MLNQVRFLARMEQFRNSPLRTTALLAAWRVRCLAGKGAIVQLEGTPLRISLPPQWHGHPKLIYSLGWRFDADLPFLVEMIPAGAVVFDIGAHLGAWSLLLSHAVGAAGKVVAYEPASATYQSLVTNIALNSVKNIDAFPSALSDSIGRLRLYHDTDSSRNSFGETRKMEAGDYEEVDATTLDQAVADLAPHRVDFVKIDVEGAEPLVLAGGASTIGRWKPVILLEVNPTALTALGFHCLSAWNALAEFGYHFFELHAGRLRFVQRCPTGMANIWAIHPSSRFLNQPALS